MLRLAQCQVQADHLDQAAKTYEMAQKIAASAGEIKLESMASIADAELAAGHGKTANALQLYQHALEIDRKLDDPRTTASDLYSYGLFLRDSGFSPRLAYACVREAESLMGNAKKTGEGKESPEFDSIVQVREDLEKKLAGQSARLPAELRKNLDSALQEALTLPPSAVN